MVTQQLSLLTVELTEILGLDCRCTFLNANHDITLYQLTYFIDCDEIGEVKHNFLCS